MLQVTRASRRSDCAIACTLDLVGDRWTLLILRDLMHGKTRFDELAQPEGIATNILAARLKWLTKHRFVRAHADHDDARRKHYALTAHGEAFRPLLRAIAGWGLKNLPKTVVFG